ncbi:MAG: ATP-binding protein [Bacteroidia bacterium]|nr:ATP-binding protein [Bacteroidia bacterium]
MFERIILTELKKWAKQIKRKPLVLRGARQVGKTTLVNMFAKQFPYFIYLNLESPSDRKLFEQDYDIDELVSAIFFKADTPKKIGDTLLFIDEIQYSAKAIGMLRYFYEKEPKLHVIAAGSLLETILAKNVSFPVGRVEYLAIRPFSFIEFLKSSGQTQCIDAINKLPFPSYAHDKLLKIFNTYCLIGGMPEAVKEYVETGDVTRVNKVYDSLLVSFIDDVHKYAPNTTLAHVIRHIIQAAFYEASKRIKFSGFGRSDYKSREAGEAFRILEKTMLLQMIYPVSGIKLPAQPDLKKSPKLLVLDTGMINYFCGLQKDIFGVKMLDTVFEGRIAEHITGQELMAVNNSVLHHLNFWTREKSSSTAELDYIWTYKNYLIPVEVKSGATGRLRSLFEFMDAAPHHFAIRIYSGQLSVDKIKTLRGKTFYLLNFPFYLLSRIDDYLIWMEKTIPII